MNHALAEVEKSIRNAVGGRGTCHPHKERLTIDIYLKRSNRTG